MTNYPFEAHENVSNNRSGIYAIVNLANNKLYIGSAVRLKQRKNLHLSQLRKNKHHSKKLQHTYNKWGEVYFVFKVVEYCERNELIEREQFWISQFDFDTQLYNLNPTAGSQLGYKHSEESRKKMSIAQKGKIFSDETREKISGACKGRIVSEEGRKNIKEAQKKVAMTKGKKVNQLDKITGEILATFYSVRNAAATMNGNHSSISGVCNGKMKTAFGYGWQFVENEI